MNVLKLIASNGFITVNIEIARAVGIEAAVILGELASSQIYWEEHGEDGMFFETAEQLEERTTLTRYQQTKAINALERAGILRTDLRGLPAKKYFYVDGDKIEELFKNKFSKNFKTCVQKTLKQDVKKLESNNKRDKEKRETIKDKKQIVAESQLSDPVKEKLIDFLDYRQEIKKPLRSDMGIKALVLQVERQEQIYGSSAVIKCIDTSMQNGWQGLFWDKIEQPTASDVFWEMANEPTGM